MEATRAGEQGHGFAVVASEVRSLADRSAEAAKEIKSLIGASVERVGHGTALVDQAGSTMKKVVVSIKRMIDIMGEIGAASLKSQAQDLVKVVAEVKVGDDGGFARPAHTAARMPSVVKSSMFQSAAVAATPKPAVAARAKPPAGSDDDWETF